MLNFYLINFFYKYIMFNIIDRLDRFFINNELKNLKFLCNMTNWEDEQLVQDYKKYLHYKQMLDKKIKYGSNPTPLLKK
jgi:hypothetical protein